MEDMNIDLWTDGVDLYASEQMDDGHWASGVITPTEEYCPRCDAVNFADYERCQCCGERAA